VASLYPDREEGLTMDGFAARNDATAMTRGDFSAQPKTTAKPRHKNDRSWLNMHALEARRTGKAKDELLENEEPAPEAKDQRVPEVPRHDGERGTRERIRRDIGSHVLVFEIGAPDNPDDIAAEPFGDARGINMHWAARCTTHDETRYFAEHRRALQAVKTSHTWCPGCAAAVAASRRIHKSRAQRKLA
jgi:hypothetical protein